ncbi:MAG TPA: endonuclease III [Bacteroidales bacterium]|nr:endonuclease III [Bacteroidales bacterium]
MTTKDRYKNIIGWFQEHMPEAKSELDFRNPYEMLVAVILSAQCTDKRVNMTTPALFETFPTAEVMAASSPEEVYTYIKSISYPNNKAKSIVGMAQKVVSDFGGRVPDTMEELLTLPGVGRKTASVVLICAFDKPAMPVDTHVFRVSNRLGLTINSKSPEETEKILMQHIPTDLLTIAHHWLILHGRYTCQARKPLCEICGLAPWCLYKSGK